MRYVFLSGLLSCCLCWLAVPVSGATRETLYDQLIATTAYGQGLEPALVKAVIKCESGFNPHAQSPKGAQGLMQLMPGTQAMLGVSQPFDPQHNVSGGTRYLAMLKQMFSSDMRLALAAYNAGPQTVISAGYVVPAIAETQHYVRCVAAAHEHYRQPGSGPLLPPLHASPAGPGPRGPSLRVPAPSAEARPTLLVNPLRLSSQVAQLGQRLSVELEAVNTSKRPGHGIVMLNYPEHLVSFMALHATGQETMVQLSGATPTAGPRTAPSSTAYQLLWSHWPAWAPGERRTAVVSLVPRVPQDITLHLSVMLDTPTPTATPQRWSGVVRIPFQAAPLVERHLVRSTTPRK